MGLRLTLKKRRWRLTLGGGRCTAGSDVWKGGDRWGAGARRAGVGRHVDELSLSEAPPLARNMEGMRKKRSGR